MLSSGHNTALCSRTHYSCRYLHISRQHSVSYPKKGREHEGKGVLDVSGGNGVGEKGVGMNMTKIYYLHVKRINKRCSTYVCDICAHTNR